MINDKDELEKALIELYQHYYCKRRDCGSPAHLEGVYQVGRCDGALDVISAIYLACFGGKKMMDLWQLSTPEE